ncbi:MAG: hypothetical protein J6Y92_11530 [Lentisphaeria bacterium]|nr:hypothetical protein [Lentisphaeria bacterium]
MAAGIKNFVFRVMPAPAFLRACRAFSIKNRFERVPLLDFLKGKWYIINIVIPVSDFFSLSPGRTGFSALKNCGG